MAANPVLDALYGWQAAQVAAYEPELCCLCDEPVHLSLYCRAHCIERGVVADAPEED